MIIIVYILLVSIRVLSRDTVLEQVIWLFFFSHFNIIEWVRAHVACLKRIFFCWAECACEHECMCSVSECSGRSVGLFRSAADRSPTSGLHPDRPHPPCRRKPNQPVTQGRNKSTGRELARQQNPTPHPIFISSVYPEVQNQTDAVPLKKTLYQHWLLFPPRIRGLHLCVASSDLISATILFPS